MLRNRENRYGSAEDVKKAILKEGVRKFRKIVLWIAATGIVAALATGTITKGLEQQENASLPDKAPENSTSEALVQDPDLPQISGQEQPADSEREQARPESTRENTQAVEIAPNATESQSSDTSTESIDDYAIEDLFKEAAGQIL